MTTVELLLGRALTRSTLGRILRETFKEVALQYIAQHVTYQDGMMQEHLAAQAMCLAVAGTIQHQTMQQIEHCSQMDLNQIVRYLVMHADETGRILNVFVKDAPTQQKRGMPAVVRALQHGFVRWIQTFDEKFAAQSTCKNPYLLSRGCAENMLREGMCCVEQQQQEEEIECASREQRAFCPDETVPLDARIVMYHNAKVCVDARTIPANRVFRSGMRNPAAQNLSPQMLKQLGINPTLTQAEARRLNHELKCYRERQPMQESAAPVLDVYVPLVLNAMLSAPDPEPFFAVVFNGVVPNWLREESELMLTLKTQHMFRENRVLLFYCGEIQHVAETVIGLMFGSVQPSSQKIKDLVDAGDRWAKCAERVLQERWEAGEIGQANIYRKLRWLFRPDLSLQMQQPTRRVMDVSHVLRDDLKLDDADLDDFSNTVCMKFLEHVLDEFYLDKVIFSIFGVMVEQVFGRKVLEALMQISTLADLRWIMHRGPMVLRNFMFYVLEVIVRQAIPKLCDADCLRQLFLDEAPVGEPSFNDQEQRALAGDSDVEGERRQRR